jgi:uncharacterized protein (DUF1015 family)
VRPPFTQNKIKQLLDRHTAAIVADWHFQVRQSTKRRAPLKLASSTAIRSKFTGKMRYSIHDKTLEAKKARILINALVDCAKAGIKPSFSINKTLWGGSLYLECGSFNREKLANVPPCK